MPKTSQPYFKAKKPKQEYNRKLIVAIIAAIAITTLLSPLTALFINTSSVLGRIGLPQDIWIFPFWIISLMILVMIIFLYKGYTTWRWTGFGEYISHRHPKDTEFQRSKPLWDWLELLIIPFVLTVGAISFNAQQNATSLQNSNLQHINDLHIEATRDANNQQLAADQQRETLLEGYLDNISGLLLTDNLLGSKSGAIVREVARVRTLAALRKLDPGRKGVLLQFLYEAGLINSKNNPIINLRLADLSSVQLDGIDLQGINLSGANLRGAQLIGIDLSGANLSKVDLTGAKLTGAHLNYALLNNSILTNADLSEANLSHADFSLAVLEDANLTYAVLFSTELSHADLYHATLNGADLFKASLFIANLGFAQLDYAILKQAYLGHADLNNANLQNANLSGADLNHVDLNHAHLNHANLSGDKLNHADLEDANFRGAKLNQVDLSDTDLSDTDLSGANICGATVTPQQLKTAKSAQDIITCR